MRYITMKDWAAFTAVLKELEVETLKAGELTAGLATYAAHVQTNEQLSEVITIGGKAVDHVSEVMQRFKDHSRKCLGLCSRSGETDWEFFNRVAAMPESALLQAMRRSCIILINAGSPATGPH